MKTVMKSILGLMLVVVCGASVAATSNPVEASAKNKYKKGDYIRLRASIVKRTERRQAVDRTEGAGDTG